MNNFSNPSHLFRFWLSALAAYTTESFSGGSGEIAQQMPFKIGPDWMQAGTRLITYFRDPRMPCDTYAYIRERSSSALKMWFEFNYSQHRWLTYIYEIRNGAVGGLFKSGFHCKNSKLAIIQLQFNYNDELVNSVGLEEKSIKQYGNFNFEYNPIRKYKSNFAHPDFPQCAAT